MAMNCIQFRRGLSLAAFLGRFATVATRPRALRLA